MPNFMVYNIYLFFLLGIIHRCHITYANDDGTKCPFTYRILWSSTYTRSPFLSSPLICELDGDKLPDIVGTLASGEVFGIHGESGYIMDNWPLYLNDVQFHSGPMLFDYNHDGLDDIVLFTEKGKILFLSSQGKLFSSDTVQIPSLPFPRYWFLKNNQVRIDEILQDFSENFLKHNDFPLYDTLSILGIDPNNSSLLFIPPHIHSTPLLGNIQIESNSREFIISLSFYFNPSEYLTEKSLRLLGGLDREDLNKYLIDAILILDPSLKFIIQFKLLSVNMLDSFEPALILSTPVIYNFQRSAERSLIVTSISGTLYKLVLPNLKFASGFPIVLGSSISNTPVIYDIDDDGTLEIFTVNDLNTVFCINNNGKVLWKVFLEGRLSEGGGLRLVRLFNDFGAALVTATENGLLYAINPNTGNILSNYPIYTGVGLSSVPLLLSLSSKFDPLLVILSTHGDLVIHSHAFHCTRILPGDFTLISRIPLLYHNFINSVPGFELLVTSEGGTLSVLSLSLLKEPTNPNQDFLGNTQNDSILFLDKWESPLICQIQNLHRNVSLSLVPTNMNEQTSFIKEFFSTDSLTLHYKISDNLLPNAFSKQYLVRGSIGNIELFSNVHSIQGIHSVTFPLPYKSLISTLSIYVTNEHGISDCIQIPVSFNVTFKHILKWLVYVPFIGTLVVLFILTLESGSILPK
ncbi:Protein DEFECTIVE IN EXINE FORMATION 1-like isoform X1 [Oopsacas minuta]|uniref:Protein DEFECTIVE IN EXINE FORMATION 1-like isoform X1 n=1 Tax=Oopsacas minuta TaxID=111878 RepID=A0AAV7JTW5_9METZ|nr:Protein DEFECTIVE IN EXINE FORMATION 1-like isoform X1 [Oopsacas minuta]